MTLFSDQSQFKRAILHVDGDSFFASCEVALNPKLKGKPVVTGLERGIASAMTYEAKRRGVTRGMRLFEIRKICPEAVILPSDYETYAIFSERMNNIVRRYTPIVEEYSIDECFADISEEVRRIYSKGGGAAEITKLVRSIKADLQEELGMTFSVGLAPTKVLAKVGSKFRKPDGCVIIPPNEANLFLRDVSIDKVWGIGPSTSVKLSKFGIRTALDFALQKKGWVEERVNKPHVEIWHELNGEGVFKVDSIADDPQKSISATRTFTPPTDDRPFVLSQLSKNVEIACAKARRHKLTASRFSYFIKTSDYRYFTYEVVIGERINTPEQIISSIGKTFDRVWKSGTLYRASGVTLIGLEEDQGVANDLFGFSQSLHVASRVYDAVDFLAKKYGEKTVFLASSLKAMTMPTHKGSRNTDDYHRDLPIWKGKKRLGLPFMGFVG